MGWLAAFAVGYVVGARGGSEGFDDVVRSAKAIRDSDEMRGFVAAVRAHVGYTLRELATRLDDEPGPDEPDEREGDLLAQVRNLTHRD
jgi:hypothetical protein